MFRYAVGVKQALYYNRTDSWRATWGTDDVDEPVDRADDCAVETEIQGSEDCEV